MEPTIATLLAQKPQAHLAIFWAGLLCGTFDITAALTVYGSMGVKPLRLLQGVAGGLLGPRTYQGGIATAALGLLCHFFIAYSAATVFYLASRYMPFMLQYAVLSGALYGIVVYFFMNRIVVPLSAAAKMPFSLKMMFIGVTIHVFCVGLPISLAIRRFSYR